MAVKENTKSQNQKTKEAAAVQNNRFKDNKLQVTVTPRRIL
jgi:hypothetical protein